MPAAAKIRAVAPWFGSKRTLAPDVVEMLGAHSAYLEPFCGSLSVLLAKPAAQLEIVNDLHGGVVALARVVSDEIYGPLLEGRVRRTLFAEEIYRESFAFFRAHPEPWWMFGRDDAGEQPGRRADANMAEWVYHYFVACWMGRNGIAGTDPHRGHGPSFAVRWGVGGGSAPARWANVGASIASWRERLAGVTILRRDAFRCLEAFEDADGAVIYLDPPYMRETRTGLVSGGATSRYLHDFADEDHGRLRDALRRFERSRIVVSYYDCPRVRELYAGWEFAEFGRAKNLRRSSNSAFREDEAPEVLICNRPARGGLFD